MMGRFLIAAALIIAVLSVLPPSGTVSGQLTTRTVTVDENTTRVEYIDENEKVTTARDRGYAVIIRSYENGKIVLEEYMDADGQSVMLSSGYHALQYTYLPDATLFTYLDVDGEEVVLSGGYGTIKRTYTETGKADADTYYIGGEQVKHTQGYWQYKRVYENELLTEIRYLDKEGNLVDIGSGYAVIQREYNDQGRIALERYLDHNEQPAAASIGQYGLYREYDENGRAVLYVYLGADGSPANTTSGYAIIRKNFEDGEKTQYYDVNDNPATMGRYQYGTWVKDGKTYYLDENGERMIRVDIYLSSHPFVVIFFGVVLTLAAVFLRKGQVLFLAVYTGFILLMTIFYRETGDPKGQFELFWSYKQFLSSATMRQLIVNNIWLFVPFGAGLQSLAASKGKSRSIWIFLIPLLFSAAIETTQYFTGFGLCELDDVFGNTLGGWIGLLICRGAQKRCGRKASGKDEKGKDALKEPEIG